MATKSTYGFKGLPVPVGSVMYHGANVVPYSFLLCNGASVSRTDYSALFAVLGDGFGSVDAEHFNLPNMITTPYMMGGISYDPTPFPSSVTFPASAVPAGAMPTLLGIDWAFQSWNLTADINGGTWYDNGNTTQQVQLTSKNAVKAGSSDVNTYSGSVTGGTIGVNNPAQTAIQPILSGGDIEPAFVTFLPIIKAFDSFIPPTYTPLPVSTTDPFIITPASQAFYPPNPESIYQNDRALSGFIF